jgi:hypothetical protein
MKRQTFAALDCRRLLIERRRKAHQGVNGALAYFSNLSPSQSDKAGAFLFAALSISGRAVRL